MFAVNPDGAEYDLTGSPYRAWRKNRQPNAGSTAIGTDLNRNYGYHWACCGGSSASKSSDTYHGSRAFSTPEARAIRDFMDSRAVDGRQQIKTAITFHTAGEQILWPYGYTTTDVPVGHDRRRPRRARRARAGRWPRPTATRRCSRAACTSPTATRSTGRTASSTIFMYTFEMYPSHSKVSSTARFYPADELIAPQTERNKAAILMLIDAAGCPYSRDRQERRTNCGPLYDDFETYGGWVVNPLGTDTATAGVWQRADPAPTTPPGGDRPVRLAGAGDRRAGRARPPTRTTSTAA